MTEWSLLVSKANHLTQVYAHITNTKESEVEWFYENLQGILGEGNGTPLQCSCLQNPRDGGAWWAAVYGVAQSRTRLKQLSRSSTRHSRTNTKKICPFHHRRLECKSRKSRDTWNNRQVWPWSTKWSRAKINRVLPWECTSHGKHTLPTTQEKTLHMDITRWSMLKSD